MQQLRLSTDSRGESTSTWIDAKPRQKSARPRDMPTVPKKGVFVVYKDGDSERILRLDTATADTVCVGSITRIHTSQYLVTDERGEETRQENREKAYSSLSFSLPDKNNIVTKL